jgi:AAA+ ATPase superfamily predicted ATPase
VSIILVKPEFVDRGRELAWLEERFRSGGAELLVIHGRRRLGKTELLKRFLRSKRCIYFLASRTSLQDNVESLKKKIAEFTGKRLYERLQVRGLGELLTYLAEEVERPCLVIDEFGYLVELDRGVLSDLQAAWDEALSRRSFFLVLCGSSVSMFETEVLGYRSPLYGRRTGSWRVEPLSFRDARSFIPRYGFEDAVRVWAAAGGVPMYLRLFDDGLEFEENLKKAVFTKGSLLYDEGYFLLREELREPSTYLALLKYLAAGYNTIGKLASAMGADKANLTKYLAVLQSLGLVKHVVPYGQRRKGIYAVADNYMWFWLKFVLPNQSELELGYVDEVLRRVRPELEQHMGLVFKELVRQLIASRAIPLPFKPTYVGQWWKGGAQIDVVALDQHNALFAEVKWGRATSQDLTKLIENSQKVDVGGRRRHYLVVAREGSGVDWLIDFEELDKLTKPNN